MHLPYHSHVAGDNGSPPLLPPQHALEEKVDGKGGEGNYKREDDDSRKYLEEDNDEGRPALTEVAI